MRKTSPFIPLLLTAFAGFTLTADEPSPSLNSEEVQSILENYQTWVEAPGEVMFTPPTGWKLADPKMLPKHVKFMVVGTGKGDFPPSINLAYDPFKGTLKDYLKMVKKYNDSIGAEWKDLGSLKTEAGTASLSQVDTLTKWGKERQMQVIFLHDGNAWIVTASALKEEYPLYYKEFFQSMKSLRINPEILHELKKTD